MSGIKTLSENIQSKLVQLKHYRDHGCQLDHARTIAEGRILQLEQVAAWVAELPQCEMRTVEQVMAAIAEALSEAYAEREEPSDDDHRKAAIAAINAMHGVAQAPTNHPPSAREVVAGIVRNAMSRADYGTTMAAKSSDAIAERATDAILAAAQAVGDCGGWQALESAPLDPLRDPPLVMLWVSDGGHKGEGTHAFGRCYRSHDGTVRGVASGFSGDWKIKYWKPLGPGPSVPSAECK